MTLTLTPEERAMLAGEAGHAPALALRIVAETARLMGAEKLIPVASAHIDGALYHGDSGTLFAERLVELGAKVAVPATLNVGGLDLACGAKTRLPPHQHDMAHRLMMAYEAMGCEPSWTCAPYQAGHRPALGSDVAWGESNAVAFCNSVLGARTNRYGDFLDIACAIAGHAPYYGLHKPENRRATFMLDCSGLSAALRGSDVLWPVIGTLYGQEAGTAVGVVTGLAGFATEDRLKAFGAAAASAGAVGLFHILGVTPEAPDMKTVTGGAENLPVIPVTPERLAKARGGLSTTQSSAIDAVAIGSPHCSAEELREVLQRLSGRKVARPFYACTGRHALLALARPERQALIDAGVTLVADTCIVVTPMLAEIAGVLATNSGKFAHYAPGNTGYAVRYASLAECVEAAVSGHLANETGAWS
ncbi:MAG: aconitase X catalytic domain-containing protein [Methylobacterium sp.]|nr:aconitase X catalytic domain-containing protein [Methylobacterium sp.]